MGSAASLNGGLGCPLSIVDGEMAILDRVPEGHLLERPDPTAQVLKMLRGGRVVAMFARSGQGKSTFIAQLITQLKNNAAGKGEASAFDIVHSVFIGSADE